MKMKIKTLFMASALVLSFGVIFSSCKKKQAETTTVTELTDSTGTTTVIVTEETDEDFSSYVYEKKDELVGKMNAELDGLSKKIDAAKAELKSQSKDLSNDAKAKKQEAIKSLEQSRDNFKVKIDDLKKAEKTIG